MSIRIATAITQTQRSIKDVTIRQCRLAQHKAPRTIFIAGLLAAALSANIADAAKSSHYFHYQASMPESSRAAHHGPAFGNDRRVSAPSQVTPASGRGIFEEKDGAP